MIKVGRFLQAVTKLKPKKLSPTEFDSIYQRAQSLVEDIPKERFDKAVEYIFKTKPEVPNEYLTRLDSLISISEKLNCPQEIKTTLSKIEQEAKELLKKSECFSIESKHKIYDANRDFKDKVGSNYKEIAEFFREKHFDAYWTADSLQYRDVIPDSYYHISTIPKGIIPENGIVYHGTKKGRKIVKEGLSACRSKQLKKASREFGAGVYATPDKKIAAYFARITGRIVPLKVDVHNTAFVEELAFGRISNETLRIAQDAGLNLYSKSTFNNAARELIISRLFREAGYDSVYTARGMSSGLFSESIDKFIGRPQSQLVIFNPERITPVKKKKIGQKIGDEILQIRMFVTSTINTIKTVLKDPSSALMVM